jgi:zinc protease
LGAFSKTDLQKVLAGKRVSVNARVITTGEAVNGSSSVKDLETAMQLLYLTFTAPRTDEAAFQSFVNRKRAELQNAEADPMYIFVDSLMNTLYQRHPRAQQFKLKELENINYPRIMEIYKERFANAGDFVFTFVGNVTPETLKPLVEQYIASLPGTKKKENYRDVRMYMPKGIVANYFDKEMEVQKTTVAITLSGDMDFTPENNIYMDVFEQILDIVYTESIREEEGGTYGVSTQGEVSPYPYGHFSLLLFFDTNADMRDKLIGKIHEGIVGIAENGPRETDVNKVKEYMLKQHTENLRDNNYWLGILDRYSFFGIDNLSDYESIVNGITPASVQTFVQKLIAPNNQVEVVMTGVAK